MFYGEHAIHSIRSLRICPIILGDYAAGEVYIQHMEKNCERYPRASVRDICAKMAEELKKLKASRFS